MRYNCLFLILISLAFLSCKEDTKKDENFVSMNNCRGEWSEVDSKGNLLKFNKYYHQGMGACITDNVALSQFEKSSEKRQNNNIECTPQVDLPSMYLRASNNYYKYRNDKIYIDLDASTGEARRLIIGEMENGNSSYSRQVFCYYLRTDTEDEPVNPQEYGSMILFDLADGASSGSFHPMEIFSYDESNNDLFLTKMDNQFGVDYKFCSLHTPWGYCDELRNGNIMYFPENLDSTIEDKLTAEAILIRSEFNFIKISQEEFDNTWENNIDESIEVGTWQYIQGGGTWKYLVAAIFDEPFFIGQAWRKYLKYERPSMPDVEWASSSQVPLICYNARREVTLASGDTAYIRGEVCYEDGEYVFTQF
jgi:hypothetical protein